MYSDLTKEQMDEMFTYQDGELFWKVDKKKMKVGQRAGRTKANGYCEIRLDGKLHGTHRLIFLMHHGFLPKTVDHIDGNPSNNRIENLRGATHEENMRNSRTPKTNSSGFKGVYFHKASKKWMARCSGIYIGVYEDIHEAANAVMNFRANHHKEFANHG